jgi:hypothetical protein
MLAIARSLAPHRGYRHHLMRSALSCSLSPLLHFARSSTSYVRLSESFSTWHSSPRFSTRFYNGLTSSVALATLPSIRFSMIICPLPHRLTHHRLWPGEHHFRDSRNHQFPVL